MNLYLIGYRCTGKSTVGEALARRLAWRFVDTDHRLEHVSGVSIAKLVETHGWPWFRKREREVLAEVAVAGGQVVATGGGIILDAVNVEVMKASGRVVWLTAEVETLAKRMLADDATPGQRPSLTASGAIAEIAAVLAERRVHYQAAADLTIATDNLTVTTICDRIVDRVINR